ncbi:MAG: hypothetical protein AAFY71_04590 [Bacteroidota bacterium]
MKSFAYFLVLANLLVACQPQHSKGGEIAEVTQDTHTPSFKNLEKRKGQPEEDQSPFYPFSYGHTQEFYEGIFKGEKLNKIDSTFHQDILTQIDGYESSLYPQGDHNFYLSRQDSIGPLSLITVSLYWDVCYEGVELLIIDKDSLVNAISLTEWYSSCDIPNETYTIFESDSVFVRDQKLMEIGPDSADVRQLSHRILIRTNGQFDTLQTLIDTSYVEAY